MGKRAIQLFGIFYCALLLAGESREGEISFAEENEKDVSFLHQNLAIKKSSEYSQAVERVSSLPPKEEKKSIADFCDSTFRAFQITARHSQGAGVGYTHGYTTLEGFFAPKREYKTWNPFLDLRGHVFNNSKFAANVGFGLRYIGSSVAWGINGYYDYRNTSRFHYNQVGAGLEAIGSFWSLRLNGYLPVGAKRSDYFGLGFQGAPSGPSFAFFQGHHFFITLSGTQELVAKREFAFKGLDADFMIRALKKNFFALDFGMGPYYFQGSYDKFAAGGRASIVARFSDYVSLSVTGTYDNLFHQRVQGAFALSIPFGAKNFRKSKGSKSFCPISSFFDMQLSRGAERSEIMALDTHHKQLASAADGDTVVAINPATGQPFEIYFVNNQSHSDGTFESPFSTLPEALVLAQENDIIYVYEGDGSPYDTQVDLLDDQMLLGSGTVQNVLTQAGVIAIPAQTSGSPTLENSGGSPVIALANGNTVSGFIIDVLNTVDVVTASSIDGVSFLNNSIVSLITTGTNNLNFSDCTGTLLIKNNQFMMDPADTGSFGIFLTDGGSGSSHLICANNTFTNHAARAISLNYFGSSCPILQIGNSNIFTAPSGVRGTDAIDVVSSGSTQLLGAISSSNVFSGYTNDVIHLDWSGAASQTFAIVGNMISSDPSFSGTRGIFLSDNSSGGSSVAILNNHCVDQYNIGISCFTGTNANLNLTIIGNEIEGLLVSGSNGIQVNGGHFSAIQVDIESNRLTNHENQGISLFINEAATIQATVKGNIVTGPDGISETTEIELGASNSKFADHVVRSN